MKTVAARRSNVRTRSRLLAAFISAAMLVVGGVTLGSGVASAAPPRQTMWIDACGMPGQIKVNYWARPGNYKTVVLLDGLRATNDVSGWEHNTRVQDMADSGVNVVQPVGGLASWYADWDAPSNFNNQQFRYEWNCVISWSLVRGMDAAGLRGPSGRYAIAGISMGGGPALVIAANNRHNFSHAFSMSGVLALSVPGTRTAVRLMLIDAGIEAGVGPFNSDSMFGPPWSPRWADNDPLIQVPKMHGLNVRVAASTGLWGQYNTDPINSLKGSPLEVLALSQTRAFEVQAAINRLPITTDYPITGTHDWGYWSEMLWRAKNSGWFR